MTIQQTERAREASPIERLAEHLAARPMPICSDDMRIMLVADWLDYSLNRCGLVVVPEQSLASEEVVEAVARAIAASFEQGSPDLAKNMRMDWQTWAPEARAAIAAMPSIPQESDAEEIQIIAQELWAQIGPSITAARAADVARAIYTAMASARDRRG